MPIFFRLVYTNLLEHVAASRTPRRRPAIVEEKFMALTWCEMTSGRPAAR